MDRLIVYPGVIPLDTDNLTPQRDAMVALGWLLQAAMGTATGVVGLSCTPTSPASLTVNVGPGAIWSQEEIDPNAYGSLSADTSPLMKLGILPEAAGTNFTLTAPTTSGQSINYLIEAAFQETDTTPVVLPYVNPSSPSNPYSGPSNSGTAQNTIRQQKVELQLKAGAAANTGSQTTPAVDSGYVALYAITVAYGQGAVTSADIAVASGAPFADFYEPDVSAQIASVISAAGLTPDRTNTAQLLAGLKALFGNAEPVTTQNTTSGTSVSSVSSTFTAPSTGWLVIIAYYTSANGFYLTATNLNTSLSGLIKPITGNTGSFDVTVGVLSMTKGQQTTFTVSCTTANTQALSACGLAFFIPTP